MCIKYCKGYIVILVNVINSNVIVGIFIMVITSNYIIKSKRNELSPSTGLAVQVIEYDEGCPIYLHT